MNEVRLDRCVCGKLEEDHFIDYSHTQPHMFGYNVQYLIRFNPESSLCEAENHVKHYTPMNPIQLSEWIERQYETGGR